MISLIFKDLWFLRHPVHHGPVRGAYNACISRVGCYGQPVTNTRSSITFLTLLLSPFSLYLAFSLAQSSVLSYFLSLFSLVSFCFMPDCSDVTVIALELIIIFEKEKFQVLPSRIIGMIVWLYEGRSSIKLNDESFSFDSTHNGTNGNEEYFQIITKLR